MSQNADAPAVDGRVKSTAACSTSCSGIHDACVRLRLARRRHVDYVKGANIAGFVKVADAMLAQGVV